MINLFKNKSSTQHGVSIDGRTAYLIDMLKLEMKKLKEYYKENILYIENRHPLVKLLRAAYVDPTLTEREYMNIANERSMHVARTLGMNTYTKTGKPFSIGFFKSDYYILSYTSNLDPDKKVEDYTPVTILYHEDTDMSLPLMNNVSSMGTPVVAVNLSELMLMYRQYLVSTENPTEGKFISQYILPGMVESYMIFSMLNRMISIHNDDIIDDWYSKHNIHTRNYSKLADKIIKVHLRKLKDRAVNLEAFFNYIPYENVLEKMQLPEVLGLIQIEWLLAYSRIKLSNNILSISSQKTLRLNKYNIKELHKYIKYIYKRKAYINYLHSRGEIEQRRLEEYLINLEDLL